MNEKAKAIEVRGSPSRCPYCHGDVEPSAEDAAVCRECLARHHSSCWSSHGTCATCGSPEKLEPGARAELTPRAARNALQRSGIPREAIDALVLLAKRAEGQPRASSGVGLAFAKLGVILAVSLGSGLLVGAIVNGTTYDHRQAALIGTAVGFLVAGVFGGILVVTRKSS